MRLRLRLLRWEVLVEGEALLRMLLLRELLLRELLLLLQVVRWRLLS